MIRINAELLVPGRGQPIDDGTVILDGDKISFAGTTADAPTTPDASVTEVQTVLPGLWECHAHFAGIPRPDLLALVTEPESRRAARATVDLSKTLDGGVTSAREVGGLGLHIAPAIDDGYVRGPTIYGAGGVLTTTGGHADVHNVPLDALDHVDHFGIICDGVPECLKAVRTNLRANAKVIKVCASGGVMSEVDHPIHQQFSNEELQAIVEEAARAERGVAAHCHGKPGIMAAVRAGVTTIEHGSYLDEEAADLMFEAGTTLVPTRYVIDQLSRHSESMPRYAYEKMQEVAGHHEQALKLAVAKEVPIAMGTDIFVSGDDYGQNSREITHLVNAGMTPLEAIEAATANGPTTLGLQAPDSGQLRAGYDADVIAIDFDPLEEVTAWGNPDRVTHVWKRGRLEKNPGLVVH